MARFRRRRFSRRPRRVFRRQARRPVSRRRVGVRRPARRPRNVRRLVRSSPRRTMTSAAASGRDQVMRARINHIPGIGPLPKDMKWDTVRCSGAARVSSTGDDQGVMARSYLQGGEEVDVGGTPTAVGTSFSDDLTEHATFANDFRQCWKTEMNAKFVNLANTHAYCTLYLMKANISDTVGTDAVVLFDPAVTWQVTNDIYSSGGEYPITSIGNTPFKNPTFVRYWKVFQTKKFFLDPGAIFSLEVRTTEMYAYNKAKVDATLTSDTGGVTIKGRTWAWMLVVSGQPAANSITPSLINVSAASVGVTWDHTMWTATVDHPRVTVSTVVNSVDGRSSTGTVIVSDETGLIVTVDEA